MVKVSVLLILIFTSLSYYLFFIEDNDSAQIKSSVTSSFDPSKKINYLGTGGGGWCNEIAVHPSNPNIVFVGSDNGGLLKSTDGGKTWTRPMGALGSEKIFNFRVCGVIIDPLDPNIVWTATGAGPFKSTDLGGNLEIHGRKWFPDFKSKK